MPTHLGALVGRYHEAFNARDFDVWREVFDEHAELVVDGMSFTGVDAAVGYGLASAAQFPNLYIGAEQIVAEGGDTVVTEIRMVNREPAGGHARQQGTACEICRVRDGRIVSCRSYYMAESGDSEEALRVPARAEATRLAEDQEALRRIAGLVARGAAPAEMFAAVIGEICQRLPADAGTLGRYESDDTIAPIGFWSRAPEGQITIGDRHPIAPGSLAALVRANAAPARVESYAGTGGPLAELARDVGWRSSVGAPVFVDGRMWGVIAVASTSERPLATNTEERVAAFAALLGTAIANAQSREDLTRLAREQAALRRVATLVAQGVPPDELFRAVAREVGTLLDVDLAGMTRYVGDDGVTAVAAWAATGEQPDVPGVWPVDGDRISPVILRTGRPAREDDWGAVNGPSAAYIRDQLGVRCSVASPITVEGRVWGGLWVHSTTAETLPVDTESRLGNFTELVATAISNMQARWDLAGSRERIVAAADEERRRVVRDLHDGAQQRLVHTVITLGLALRALENDHTAARTRVMEALDQARRATHELRELSHGIMPAVLTRGGLRLGTEALTSRSSVPVDVDISVGRLPSPIEATAYFVVAEALTNVSKHARATRATVTARIEDDALRVDVRDDGVGGAQSEGSGLMGLRDRLAVLDGRLRVESAPGGGTLVTATIPLRKASDDVLLRATESPMLAD